MAKSDNKNPETPSFDEEALNKLVNERVQQALDEQIPAIYAAVKRSMENLRPATPINPGRAPGLPTERCHVCLQRVVACKGEHVELVVAPRNRRYYKDFPGICVNGVLYRSPKMSKAIPVPKENQIAYMVKMWEIGEDELRTGRTLDHDSGTLSPRENNNRPRAANPIGFRELVG